VLLDVGANVGQFAKSIRKAGYGGRIVSFEPLQDAHAKLVLESDHDDDWQVAPRVAIGAHEGEVEINVAANSFSSSILGMLPNHERVAPDSSPISVEHTPLAPLDIAARSYMREDDVIFIKIDTQGYEDRVLQGATDILARAAGLHVELSFVPLYEGQPLFDEIVEQVLGAGFSMWNIWPGIFDPESGRMLQVDATFFRDSAIRDT
jgi:FkbM family methyltransferase